MSRLFPGTPDGFIYPADFERFWAAYPWRSKKGDALKAWNQLRPSAALVDAILTALAWQVSQPRWTKDNGAYVPLPASYLRARQWEDERPAARPMTGLQKLTAKFSGGQP